MKADPIIKVNGLHKSFPRGPEVIHVLTGVEMTIGRGEGLAVVGASGSGKSTLLHLLGGLEHPDKGSILYGERELARLKTDELAAFRNQTIGFVFQFHFLLPEFTAFENVLMPALLAYPRPRDHGERAAELLQIMGLENRSQHKPGQLSGGEQQRVALARALMMNPAVLLADEPTGDLDPETGERMRDLLISLKERLQLTMVIATHNLGLAQAMDRIVMLKGGRLEPYER